jgi:hypothetical protein
MAHSLEGDDKELQQCARETKLNTSEQETNNLTTSTVSLSSTSTQTMNLSDPKSLTYLIQALISHSIGHFNLDEKFLFIEGKTEGVCRISSVDPRLSSVSLYCEYELGKVYLHSWHSPKFAGYPIALKSSFNLYETNIITGLDESKTKFIDNDNYVIEFVEMFEREELIKSSLNISDPSIGTTSGQASLAPQTRTAMTQTKTYIEDKETLTYIAKGIMFKSICFFSWDEHKVFSFGKKVGILRIESADHRLKGMTLTCNYKLAKVPISFQGDIGYPMIVSCSYGSVKTILRQDKKKILDNNEFDLTFRS